VDLIILLVRLKSFCLLFVVLSASARENFVFGDSDEISILADKAYKKTQENSFEAIGNVIITHQTSALYGEKAFVSMITGEVHIEGNVRYISPKTTLYGTEILYHFNNKQMSIENARIVSENYVVVAKNIFKESDDIYLATEAEYSTCRDCPESWSVYGKQINITVGEYVRIKHAFIKIKGVIIAYFPYIVFPIKKKRESGLLFPKMGLNFETGLKFHQPWYWAINDSQDLTFTPGIWGKRGEGAGLEYRQMLGDRKWFQLDNMGVFDRIYEEGKQDNGPSGHHELRSFSEYEHHFNFGNNINHHFTYNYVNDLDIQRDYDEYLNNKIQGPDMGGKSFLEFRNSLFQLDFESYFSRQVLVDDPKEFDHKYVQTLPKINLQTIPINLFHIPSPVFSSLQLTASGDYTIFKQNHIEEAQFIRNAERVNLNPNATLQLFHIGPFAGKTQLTWDYQKYYFPTKPNQQGFLKKGFIHESEMSFEVDKVFGMALYNEVPLEDVRIVHKYDEDVAAVKGSELIRPIVPVDESLTKNTVTLSQNAYRHSQQFKLKHFYLTDQEVYGNPSFEAQVRNENGIFDNIDTIRSKQTELTDKISKTSLPLNNTAEVQWNNSLIRKRPKIHNPLIDERYLKDNFEYDSISYLNVSQGYDLALNSEQIDDKLTRLFVNSGINIDKFSFGAYEYYYYSTTSHLFQISASKEFDYFKLSNTFNYDSFSSPVRKFMSNTFHLKISDLILLKFEQDYDLERRTATKNLYGIIYRPKNNCWLVELAYTDNLVDEQISINIGINYNDNNFKTLNK
jgi:LPS-assembly protein